MQPKHEKLAISLKNIANFAKGPFYSKTSKTASFYGVMAFKDMSQILNDNISFGKKLQERSSKQIYMILCHPSILIYFVYTFSSMCTKLFCSKIVCCGSHW